MVRNHFIHYNKSRLHYARTGRGDKVLLLFHGFGQEISAFEYLARALQNEYTVYVFDLYFHGASQWAHDENPLRKEEWAATMETFLKDNAIDRFGLAGFSLGGKFVLATLEAFSHRVTQIHLIAPDGIATSFWYNLATWPIAFRKLFKSMIQKPRRFLTITQWLNRIGLVDAGLIRFAEFQMSTEERRRRVYYSWVVFRHLRFNLPRLAALINQHHIQFTLITGRYDKVIVPEKMEPFLKRLSRYQFKVLESGHTGLINASLPFFTAQARG